MADGNISQVRGLVDMWQFLNGESLGMWGIALVVMIFIFFLLALKSAKVENKKAFAGSVFATFVLSVWLFSINLINSYVLGFLVVGMILSIFWLKSEEA